MNLFRHRLVRVPIVAFGAAAWLAISNHCALAAMQNPAEVRRPSCHAMAPAKEAPAKDEQKNVVECCKVLRATLLTLSKNLAAADTLAFVAHTYVGLPLPRAVESRLISIFEWDTGPPGAGSFAELVLQRSILAHAPPSQL
ncbi:MAG: hypothetical protein LC627_01595 [Verrucomicrobiaceae bacterium]|nr:hypothetical protein [Verrucomicrobiaceae bacterium]